MNQCLSDILKNGEFETLRFGSDLQSAVAMLGIPEGQTKFGNNEILKYGELQLFFEAGILIKIILATTTPVTIRVMDAILEISSKTSVEQFINVCEALEIPWTINRTLTFDRQLCISTNNTTDVFFDLDHRELSKIQLRHKSLV